MNHELINDIIQWDIKTWSKALHYWESSVEWNKVNSCLEIGGKGGGISLWLSLKGKKVICSDVENIRESSFDLHHKYSVDDKIVYQDIDAIDIPYKDEFDLIVFKSIIGGIGEFGNIQKQEKVFSEILKALKPGGVLLFAENLSATSIHQLLRKKYISWGKSWRYITLAEMKKFLENFSEIDLYTTGFSSIFGRSEKQKSLLYLFDELIFNKLVSDNSKYLVYGKAYKKYK